MKKKLEIALLNHSHVIFSTLSTSGRQLMLKSEVKNVDILIVDEAGQSIEAETLIAFQKMPGKVLLVGDTKQLPATITSELAKSKNFGRSMMERLEQNGMQHLMLSIQYRMNIDICQWPSTQYYGGALETEPTILPNSNTGINQAIAFYDVITGKESKVGTSRKNEKEIDYVMQCIRKLRETDSESRIGVITFYAAQVDDIQDKLQREHQSIKQKVTVNTVDGFQGDEREIIILSCVCSNNKSDIGFLQDERRLNVAISRAKNTLIILGNARTLESTASDVKEMITNLRSRGKFYTEQQLNINLGNEILTLTQKQKKLNQKATIEAAPSVSPHLSSSNIFSCVTKTASSVQAQPKKTKNNICKLFTGAPNSCNKGSHCKFIHQT